MAYIPPIEGKVVAVEEDGVLVVLVRGFHFVADPINDVARLAPAVRVGDKVMVSDCAVADKRAKWGLP